MSRHADTIDGETVRHIDPCGSSCDRCTELGADLHTATAPKAKKEAPPRQQDLSEGAADLFEELRALRLRLARERGLPAYMVFNDATLREMATRLPSDREELLAINGVGHAKLDTYGDEFLAVIATWLDS